MLFTAKVRKWYSISQRVRWEMFLNHSVPFLACSDLAVFKAFFDRTQYWADLEARQAADTLNIDVVSAVLALYRGADDSRIRPLDALR